MRAVAVADYGATPVVTQIPEPHPAPGELLIRTLAASMNPMDRNIAEGSLRDTVPATFPMVLGIDIAGVVEDIGPGATQFAPGDEVFGQVMIAPLGVAGTYAEEIAVPEHAPLARVPDALDPMVAAALPTAGGTGLDVVDSLEPLRGKTVLIVGAGGGVGSFATQFAANAGAHVIANTHESAEARMRDYGAAEVVDHSLASVMDAVRAAHPDGIDALIDLASDGPAFAELASLVRPGGTALTTRFVADPDLLGDGDGRGAVNYQVTVSSDLLERVADAVVAGRIAPPPIRDIRLEEVPDAYARMGHADGKTVITI